MTNDNFPKESKKNDTHADSKKRRYDSDITFLEKGRYRVLRKLGQGGMGEVFLALDTELGREFALKLIPTRFAEDKTFIDSLKKEALITMNLDDYRGLCRTFDFVDSGQNYFLKMEYLQGKTLKETLTEYRQSGQKFSEREVMEIGIAICQGLSKLHQSGIVHKDLKPGNIMLCDNGSIKIMDFGISSPFQNESLDGVETSTGTASYISPEQILGEHVGDRSDIYSLGLVLFELLTFESPFGKDISKEPGWTIIARKLNEEPLEVTHFRSEVYPPFIELISQCIQKEPDERIKNCYELNYRLELILTNLLKERVLSGASPRQADSKKSGPGSEIKVADHFSLVCGDICDFKSDAIINSTDETLSAEDGIDRLIRDRGGQALEDVCRQWIESGYRLKPCEAMATDAGNLNTRMLIHVNTPTWTNNFDSDMEKLMRAYWNGLLLAIKNQARVISVPVIGTGRNHFPLETAARAALNTIRKLLYLHDDKLDLIRLVVFDSAAYERLKSQFVKDNPF